MPKSKKDELAAFSVRSSKSSPSEEKMKKSSKVPKSSETLTAAHVPYVGIIRGIDEIDLCTDSDAGIDQHIQDTERLVKAFDVTVNTHELLILKAVNLTEQRCAADKRCAVEAATLAVIQTTELRLTKERHQAVEKAVMDALTAAKAAQEQAVKDAIKATELRCAEMQRLAVQEVTARMGREMGKAEEEVFATTAATSFQAASNSAGAALAAASSLLRDDEPLPPHLYPNSAAAAPPQADIGNAGSGDSLHFF